MASHLIFIAIKDFMEGIGPFLRSVIGFPCMCNYYIAGCIWLVSSLCDQFLAVLGSIIWKHF